MKSYTAFLILTLYCSVVAHAGPLPERQQYAYRSPQVFRENKGQVTDQAGASRSDIDFQLHTNGTSVFIGRGTIHYQWDRMEKTEEVVAGFPVDTLPVRKLNTYRLDVTLLGCNTGAVAITEDPLPGYDIFYSGVLNGVKAHSFRKITYRDIYPGIDWVLYVKDTVLKYDFIVRPGGKVSDIKIHYGGARELKISEGKMLAVTPMGSLTEQKPYAYIAETGTAINAAFDLDKDVLRFAVDSWAGTLIIDPELRLDWATYYGGIAPEPSDAGVNDGDWISKNNALIATDGKGNVYLTGTTMSNDNIATSGSYQSTRNNISNVFLVKFDSNGLRKWATYYGGTAANYMLATHSGSGHAVACDTLGNVYLTGCTWNTEGIATPNAYQTSKGGAPPLLVYYWPDLFLAKFDGDGTRQWATYYGGSQAEAGGSVAVSPDGSKIYLAGMSNPNAQANYNIASLNAAIPYTGITNNMPQAGFLTRFNAAGQRVWGTYINPTTKGYTILMDIALDIHGYIYLCGSSHADPGPSSATDTSITTWGSFQQYNNSPFTYGRDAFLQKWDSTGNRLWGTFYGGSESIDLGCGLACDDTGNVYLTGITNSSSGFTHGVWCIATPGSYKETFQSSYNGFLAKFNGAGQRQWGTYFDGYGAAAASTDGEVFLTGSVSNGSLAATSCAHQVSYGGSGPLTFNAGDAFLARFTTAGHPDYITYYGGAANDIGTSLAIDKSQENHAVYLAGGTQSHQDIATPGSHKDALIGNEYDVFLARFFRPRMHEFTSCFSEDSILIKARDTTATGYVWNDNSGGHSLWVKTSGYYTVSYQKKPGCITVDSFLVHIYPLPALTALKGCPGQGQAIATTQPGNQNLYTYSWHDAAGALLRTTEHRNGDTLSDLGPGAYTLKIETPAGCDTVLNFVLEAYPAVVLAVSNDTVVPARSRIGLWATGADHYSWAPEIWLDNALISGPVASPRAPITYTVTGTSQYGCQAVDSVRIDIMEDLFIPNAFSPNGDGRNDEFKIGNYGYQQLLEFRIFNRWGEQVFWTVNPDTGWNGTYRNAPADLGTYSYYIRLRQREGKERTFKGNLTLIR